MLEASLLHAEEQNSFGSSEKDAKPHHYSGPPRIVTKCTFVEPWGLGGLAGEFEPMEECPDSIVESWKCYRVCLNSSMRPDRLTGQITAQLTANRTGSLKSWAYRTEGINHLDMKTTEGGQYVFMPDLSVEPDYPAVFEAFNEMQMPCKEDGEDIGPFGQVAMEQYMDTAEGRHGSMRYGPDFAGFRHCARAGCVPGEGGWSETGTCQRTNWQFQDHLKSTAEDVKHALQFLKMPSNSTHVVQCIYEEPLNVGSRNHLPISSRVRRILNMPERPVCAESRNIGDDDSYRCFRMCPGFDTGFAELADEGGSFDEGLLRPIIPSRLVSDSTTPLRRSLLKGFVLEDAVQMRSREFEFLYDHNADYQEWQAYFQTSSMSMSREVWTERNVYEPQFLSAGESGGWTLSHWRRNKGATLKDHLQNAANELIDASMSEIARTSLFEEYNLLKSVLAAAESLIRFSRKTSPARQKPSLAGTIEEEWTSGQDTGSGMQALWAKMFFRIAECISDEDVLRIRRESSSKGERAQEEYNVVCENLDAFQRKIEKTAASLLGKVVPR